MKNWEKCYKQVGMSPRGRDKFAIEIAIKEAKQEVFDDIEKIERSWYHMFCRVIGDVELKELKKKHLDNNPKLGAE